MEWLKEQLILNRKERRAIISLIVIILAIQIVKQNLPNKNSHLNSKRWEHIAIAEPTKTKDQYEKKSYKKRYNYADKKTAQHKEQTQNDASSKNYKDKKSKNDYAKTKSKIELHPFNPNTVSKNELLSFGLSQYVVNNWTKYLASGANFKKPSDLKKIYGLEEKEYEQMQSFIKIPAEIKTAKREVFVKKDRFQKVEINTANQEIFEGLKGIGPSYASRIVKFRDALGGFHSIDQIKETYGFPDSTFQSIKEHLEIIPLVSKINLNTADKEELSKHPYLSYKEADIILRYRRQHGDFKEVSDLDKIKIFTEEKLIKLMPYLTK